MTTLAVSEEPKPSGKPGLSTTQLQCHPGRMVNMRAESCMPGEITATGDSMGIPSYQRESIIS